MGTHCRFFWAPQHFELVPMSGKSSIHHCYLWLYPDFVRTSLKGIHFVKQKPEDTSNILFDNIQKKSPCEFFHNVRRLRVR